MKSHADVDTLHGLNATQARPWRPSAVRGMLKDPAHAFGLLTIAAVIILGVFGPELAPYDPKAISLGDRLVPPSGAHWLGTDHLGRDLLSRMLHGARTTFAISAAAVVLAAGLGSIVGILSAYRGGWVDNLLMRVVDVQLAYPSILLAILIVALLGTSLAVLIAVFVVAGWVKFVRVARSRVIEVKELDFVEAAYAGGIGTLRLLTHHIFPSVVSAIAVMMGLEFARVILIEASLSYLGLGVQPPDPTWGNMIYEAQPYMHNGWWAVMFPGLAVMFVVLGLNWFSDGLQAVLDPARDGFST